MLKKVILLVFDGLGDRPVEAFGGLTPLESADTPNLDDIAKASECGMVHTLKRGLRPGSDVSHLAIFGYEPDKYYCGRGPIEVSGLGLELQDGDVALRGNLGTVDDDLMIKDRRAGRILDVSPFTKLIDGLEIDGVKFIVRPGTAHRAGVIMRGSGLSSEITEADPHEPDLPVETVMPKDDTSEAKHTADVLNKFLLESHKILKSSEANKERVKSGDLPANFLLVRGAGQFCGVPKFSEKWGFSPCCIAGGGLYKGIGTFLGMDVIPVDGATALPNTDIEAKFKATLKQLNTHDFAFVHVKATDTLGEDGDYEGKKDFIEKIDRAIKLFVGLPNDTLLIITADHSTPCELKAHSGDPVPIMFYGKSVRVDSVSSFGERSCTHGGLGFVRGVDIMPHVMNLMGRLHLIGA